MPPPTTRPPLSARVRGLVLGAPQETRSLRGASLPKRLALPVFGADGVSSLAYAPDEIIMVLALAGTAALSLSPWIGFFIAVMLLVVIGTYRYNMREVTSSGGDRAAVERELGPVAGTAVAASLLFDFVLAVSVSVSSASGYLAVLVPALAGHRLAAALALVVLLSLLHRRGVRAIGRLAAWPMYLFLAAVSVMVLCGLVQATAGTLGTAPGAAYQVQPHPADAALTQAGLVLLAARAFSSGAVTLTGVESLSSAVGFFRRPRERHAALTLMITGTVSGVFLVAVLYLARASGAVVAMDTGQLLLDGRPVGPGFHQVPVLGQVARAVFGAGAWADAVMVLAFFLLLSASAAAFIGFPILASSMARDGELPVHFDAARNRAVHGNGVLALGVGALLVTAAFGADVNALVQLYVLGVLFAMSLTQAAVMRSRARTLRRTVHLAPRRRLLRAQAVTALGLTATVLSLVVVLLTKIWQGAWVTVLVVLALTLASRGIAAHYRRIDEELAVDPHRSLHALPSRVHAMVVVPRLRRPALRALAYARAARPSSIEAVVTNVEEARTRRIREEWDRLRIPVPLTVLDAPYRDPLRPVVDYVRSVRKRSPRDVVMVYIPEYVLDHAWQKLLHPRSSRRLARALGREPGVVTAMVPWRLGQEPEEIEAGVPDAEPAPSRPGRRAEPPTAAAGAAGQQERRQQERPEQERPEQEREG